MNVSIPPGRAAVALQAGANTALCAWDAAEVVTSPAAPASGNSRIDVVILQVRDPQLDAGVNNDFLFQLLAGAPTTGTPVAPTVPANAMAICSYTVPGAAANLNGVTVNDARIPLVGPATTGRVVADMVIPASGGWQSATHVRLVTLPPFPAVAGRRYVVSGWAVTQMSTAKDIAGFFIGDGVTTFADPGASIAAGDYATVGLYGSWVQATTGPYIINIDMNVALGVGIITVARGHVTITDGGP
jgi:hypothetical protein